MSGSIIFGWGAPSFLEQLPQLSAETAKAFDADNEAIIRLSVRGALTSSQRDAAIRKVTRSIEKALSAAREASSPSLPAQEDRR